MFFSKVFLVAIFVGAVSVFATPHALQHHALHRRAVAARVAASVREASAPNNATVGRQHSPKCSPRSTSSSTIPAVSVQLEKTQPSPVMSSQPSLPPPSPSPSPSPTTSSPPTPSPTPSPSPTSTQPAPPATTSSTAGSGPFSGQATFYAAGLGACGVTNGDTDYICAVSELLFDQFPGYNGVNPNDNPVCGRKIQINYQGKSITVTVEDRCTACQPDDLDLTPSAFAALANPDLGRVDMTWTWL